MLTTGANHGWSYRLERKIWFTCTWKKEQALDAFLCIDARRGAGNRQDNRQSTRIKFLAPPSSASHWKCHKVFEGFFYCVLLHVSRGKSSRRHGLAGECHCTYLPQRFSACIVEFFLRVLWIKDGADKSISYMRTCAWSEHVFTCVYYKSWPFLTQIMTIHD